MWNLKQGRRLDQGEALRTYDMILLGTGHGTVPCGLLPGYSEKNIARIVSTRGLRAEVRAARGDVQGVLAEPSLERTERQVVIHVVEAAGACPAVAWRKASARAGGPKGPDGRDADRRRGTTASAAGVGAGELVREPGAVGRRAAALI